MRSIGVSNSTLGISGTISYPDEYCFVFNPNYVEFSLSGLETSLTVTLADGSSSYALTVSSYGGKGRAYISRVMRLFFSDYLSTRSKGVTITVSSGTNTVMTASTVAIWGGLVLGEQFNRYGTWIDSSFEHRRKVVWFTNFPFKVSLFVPSDTSYVYSSTDGGSASATAVSADGIVDFTPSVLAYGAVSYADIYVNISSSYAPFLQTIYDHYGAQSGNKESVHLVVDSSTTGYYLRWIDQFGFLQYYLFVKGELTVKNEGDDSHAVNCETIHGGVYYAAVRNGSVESTDTVKCSAVNLGKEVMAYVSSVVKSPYVDLYGGTDSSGDDIWIPVNIVSGSYKHGERDVLGDFEIQFTLPQAAAQEL